MKARFFTLLIGLAIFSVYGDENPYGFAETKTRTRNQENSKSALFSENERAELLKKAYACHEAIARDANDECLAHVREARQEIYRKTQKNYRKAQGAIDGLRHMRRSSR